MRRMFPIVVSAFVSQSAQAAIQGLPFQDQFTYAEGNLYAVASGVWDAAGSSGSEITVNTAAALNAPAGLFSASGKGVKWTPSGTARRSIVQFTAVTGGTLYASFLVSIVTPPSSGSKLVAYFDSSTSQPSSPQLGFFVSNGSVGVGKKASTPGASVSVGSGTHFVVVRYAFTGTSTDVADLWVDPPSSTFGAVSAPASSATTSGGNNVASIPYFGIYTSSGAGPTLYLDEVRIGTSWASVTPTGVTPPTQPPSPPNVTKITIGPTGITLSGTNGLPNGEYHVLTATNLALARDQWSVIATNYFRSAGDFDWTNPAPTPVPRRFYCLRALGGTNAQATPPTITTQPQNQTVLAGQSALFSVVATGTTPLAYQWYFSNAAQTGATNSSLTINNVQTNNVGDYFVVVTNSAGAVTSDVVTLTVSTNVVAPSISTQPQNQTATEGGSATFSVVASGTAPLRYQWYFNNAVKSGATSSSLALSNVQTNQAGSYFVLVTNSAGATTSSVAILTVNPVLTGAVYYVSPSGSDTNAGTLAAPFATPQKALTVIASGDTIYLRGGTYNLSTQVKPNIAGTSSNYCELWAYSGERPVLDFSSTSSGTKAMYFGKDYWHVKGIEVANATDTGIFVAGMGNIIEGCVIHDCNNDGLVLGSTTLEATNALVLNCDSYRNYQVGSGGNNGDGFAAKAGCGPGNVFRGCRAWNNADDAWDFYDNDVPVTLEGCWAFSNGYDLWGYGAGWSGNGNGFKLGGEGTSAEHNLTNCVAFGNRSKGFDHNNGDAGQTMVNCTSYSNNAANFSFYETPSKGTRLYNLLINCVSFVGTLTNLAANTVQISNSWQHFTVTAADFASLDTPQATNARNADYSLPDTQLFRLSTGSQLIDKGVNVGLPYNGSAPDLGAFETAPAGDYYVATNGSDSNPGTIGAPFATLPKAISVASAGNLIYVRGGTHYYSSTITIAKSGTSNAPIRLFAYPGEQPVLNFSSQPYGSANRGILITSTGNWWQFKGLEICYAGDNGIKVEGSHHRFEQCVFHHNGDTGLQIGFGHDDSNPDGQLAAFIEVINCDSSYNYDPDSNGGDADGFAAKMHCGRGIVFTGCRAWYNSDDGWDLYETDYSVVISNCWAWKSAYVGQGNGNGFKMGGNGTGGDSKGTHCAYRCVAFGCKVNGFTQNSHKDGEAVVNCLAFSNGNSGYNFYFEGSLNSGKVNAFTNNASIPRSGSNTGGFIEDNSPFEVNNSWNLSVTVSSADCADLTEAAAGAARQSDGSLPTGFARLVAGSDLIDKGVDVGLPFNGTAPDLGPYEYAP